MDIFSIFEDVAHQANRLYSQDTDFDRRERMPFPPVNVCEDADALHVRALLPGADPRDIRVFMRGGALVLEGEIPQIRGAYCRKERFSGRFRRVVPLETSFLNGSGRISLRLGVLEIVLPKAGAARAGR